MKEDSFQVRRHHEFTREYPANGHVGALYYISTWYKRDETSLRVSLFFFGQIFAGATTSLISAGLLELSGKGNLAGWQWIFLGTLHQSCIVWGMISDIQYSRRTYHHSGCYCLCAVPPSSSRRWTPTCFFWSLELLHRARITHYPAARAAWWSFKGPWPHQDHWQRHHQYCSKPTNHTTLLDYVSLNVRSTRLDAVYSYHDQIHGI